MEVGGVLDNPDRSPLPLVDYLKVSYNSSLLPQQEKSTISLVREMKQEVRNFTCLSEKYIK